MTFSSRPARELRIVGAIAPAEALDAPSIARALANPQTTSRASDFPGRSSTSVWASDHVVVKGRVEFAFAAGDVDRWVAARLTRERTLGCYPADRTWFAVDDDGRGRLGVATRRLRPLHLWGAAEIASQWDRFTRDFVRIYLDAAEQGWRLDEGLSNFAWPESGPLRYLDDDLYPWDDGVGLAVALDVLGRRMPVLGHDHGEAFGAELREQLRRRPQLLTVRHVADDIRGSVGSVFGDGVVAALTRRVSVPRTPSVVEPPAEPAAGGAPDIAPRHPSGRRNDTTLVIADVHANLDALDAVLATEDALLASRIVVLGDSVGYGPDPLEVVQRLARDERVVGILGNHDLAAIAGAPPTFNAEARWSAQWTADRLDDDSRAWLEALPRERLDADGWLALHGAPIDPERLNAYVYRMTADDNLAALEVDGIRLCLHGNTHIAGAWVRRRRGADAEFCAPTAPLDVSTTRAALVCPGGLGQPRDGMSGAAYAVLDPASSLVRFERISYDHSAVQQRMRAEGFPRKLVERLDRAG